MATVVVNDGQTEWCCDKADLIAALDAAGWERGMALGQKARFEPSGDGGAYIALCNAVDITDMPEDTSELQHFSFYPAENAWIWEMR